MRFKLQLLKINSRRNIQSLNCEILSCSYEKNSHLEDTKLKLQKLLKIMSHVRKS